MGDYNLSSCIRAMRGASECGCTWVSKLENEIYRALCDGGDDVTLHMKYATLHLQMNYHTAGCRLRKGLHSLASASSWKQYNVAGCLLHVSSTKWSVLTVIIKTTGEGHFMHNMFSLSTFKIDNFNESIPRKLLPFDYFSDIFIK